MFRAVNTPKWGTRSGGPDPGVQMMENVGKMRNNARANAAHREDIPHKTLHSSCSSSCCFDSVSVRESARVMCQRARGCVSEYVTACRLVHEKRATVALPPTLIPRFFFLGRCCGQCLILRWSQDRQRGQRLLLRCSQDRESAPQFTHRLRRIRPDAPTKTYK